MCRCLLRIYIIGLAIYMLYIFFGLSARYILAKRMPAEKKDKKEKKEKKEVKKREGRVEEVHDAAASSESGTSDHRPRPAPPRTPSAESGEEVQVEREDQKADARVDDLRLRLREGPRKGKGKSKGRGQQCPHCYRHFAHESGLEQHLQWNQRCVASEIYERKRVTWQEAQEEAEMEIAQREQDWRRRGEGSGRGGGVRGKTEGPERKKDKKKRKKAPSSPTPVRTVRRDRRPPSPSTSSGRPKKKGGAGPRGPTVIHLHVGGSEGSLDEMQTSSAAAGKKGALTCMCSCRHIY